MTAVAGGRRVLMRLIDVAVRTVVLKMLAEQRVAGRIVVELNLQPVIRIVAIGTGVAEEILMHVIFDVTVNTCIGSVAVFHIRRMAFAAVSLAVLADKFVVRQQVIETCFDEIDNIGSSSLMFCMARGAGFVRNIVCLAMESAAVIHVGRDVFMTIATQLVLPSAIE